MTKLCSIDGCASPARAKSMCSSHYMRMMRHGDPLGGEGPGGPRICSIDTCGKPHEARGWCQMHYRRFQRNGDPTVFAPQYSTVEDALTGRSVQEGECRVWTGAKSADGYGRIKHQGAPRGAHRVAWELIHGVVPHGMELDHLCRNRACINVDHLEPVTHAENMRRTTREVLDLKYERGGGR